MTAFHPQDRRLQSRTQVNSRGVAIAPGVELVCVIADASGGGFRLRLDRNMALPGRITVIDVAAGVAHEADVAWRQGLEVGLKLRSQATVRGLVPSRLLPAREAWLRAGGR